MIDPRPAVIEKRLDPIARILAFASAKGGVGKSVCAALSALALASAGRRTGLLDLDFQGASAHVLLKAPLGFPEEASGIKPLRLRERLEFMSFASFSRERAVPLRGREVTEALVELLAVTVWDPLDCLLIDMPPGIGDELLDVLRFMRRTEFVVIATPSALALRVVERFISLIKELRLPLLGVIENMARGPAEGAPVAELAARHGTRLLGSIPYLAEIESLLSASDPLTGPLEAPMRRILSSISGILLV